MQIVIAGAGEVGFNIAKDLAYAHDVYVIENDERKITEISKLNVEVIEGNAANIEILKRAKIDEADIFLGVTGDDEVNLLAGLAAKKLGAKKTIIRVGNPEYVDKPIVMDHPIGYDLLICPQLALASEIVNLITIPGAVDFVTFSGGKIDMVEISITSRSGVGGKRISELHLPGNVIITAIYRNGELIVPKGETVLKEGDRLAIVGTMEDLSRIRGIFGEQVARNVVIFGGGTVGGYIARLLDRSNIHIKLIDSSPSVCETLCSVLKRTKVIIGDATDLDLLVEEEIGKSDVVIATTDSDEKNLLVSLLAKSLGARKAIVKVDRGMYVKLFEKVGVDVALSPRRITYNEVMKHLHLMNVHTIAEIGKGEAAVLEIEVREKLSGKMIRELKMPKGAIIGAILRGDDCLIPKGDTKIYTGDKLLVITTWGEMDRVEKALKD